MKFEKSGKIEVEMQGKASVSGKGESEQGEEGGEVGTATRQRSAEDVLCRQRRLVSLAL